MGFRLLTLAFSLLFIQVSLAAVTRGKSGNFTFIGTSKNELGVTYGYLLSSETANFFKAFVSCLESDTDLAAITVEEQEQKLDFYLRTTAQDGDSFWLAGTNLPDVSTSQFYWFTGGKRAVYTDWLPGEPNNDGGNENCLGWEKRADVGVGWNDYDCTIEKRYICQYAA